MKVEQANIRDVATLVSLDELRKYVALHGWHYAEEFDGLNLYRRNDDELAELVVPKSKSVRGANRAVWESLVVLAEQKGVAPDEIARKLLNIDYDVVEVTIASPSSHDGALPIQYAVSMFRAITEAISASAHSVLEPKRHHPRLGKKEAIDYLNTCRFGQTRVGSFTATAQCPLKSSDHSRQLNLFEHGFGRETITAFASSLQVIAGNCQARSSEFAPNIYASDDDSISLVSGNLCKAISDMDPRDGAVTFDIDWSEVLPVSLSFKPVRFEHEDFERIAKYSDQLRYDASTAPERRQFIGYIEDCHNTSVADGKDGEVRVRVLLEEGDSTIKIDLAIDEYKAAVAAHLESQPVAFEGTYEERYHKPMISDVCSFQVVSRK